MPNTKESLATMLTRHEELPTPSTERGIVLVPREMVWNFDDVPACFITEDPDVSAYLLALSVFVVVFEDFVQRTVPSCYGKLEDHPLLLREVRVFVTQEAMHAAAHKEFNAAVLDAHGFDQTEIHRWTTLLHRRLNEGDEASRLALLAAGEHLIYSVASWFVSAKLVQRALPPEVNRLVSWHSMEEIEHTAIAYDLYQHLYGHDRWTRMKGFGHVHPIPGAVLHGIWNALRPQVAARATGASSRSRAYLRMASALRPYLHDHLQFLKSNYHPFDRAKNLDEARILRREVRAPEERSPSFVDVRVAAVRDVAIDVRAYDLVAEVGESLPPFEAGAHIDVEIDTGIVRPYSLCGDPADRGRYVIAVKREPTGRGASLRLHHEIAMGDRLRVRVPRNEFRLDPNAEEYTLVAGGIGVTPLLAMAYELHAKGIPFVLHVVGREPSRLPFFDVLKDVPFSGRVHLHVDSSADNGRVHPEGLVSSWRPGCFMAVCGPIPFITGVIAHARTQGWPDETMRTERFRAESKSEGAAFTVQLARSRRALRVEAGESLALALEACGHRPNVSCGRGMCGSCVVRVIEGEIEHRDSVLSEEERRRGDKVAVCVSRAKGGVLVLDL